MDPDLVRNLWRDCQLNTKTAKLITENGLLKCKIPGLRNFKDLYNVYMRHGPAIWSAGNEQAEETISLPSKGEGNAFSHQYSPKPKANVLHMVASFNGADKIKSLSDIGSMLALWAIEETCFWVTEDMQDYQDEPEEAQYADLWAKPPEMEDMGGIERYDETILNRINNLLQE